MGGEKGAPALRAPCCRGSPPRGRGKGNRTGGNTGVIGITPAWAGKSFQRGGQLFALQDHPRVGGEKHGSDSCSGVCQGSPPRGRGKERRRGWDAPPCGITPAWAGKSLVFHHVAHECRDHPRVGGEKNSKIALSISAQGSPPRGRGKETREGVIVIGRRITPAWAGKSCKPDTARGLARDHPRVGGEKQN